MAIHTAIKQACDVTRSITLRAGQESVRAEEMRQRLAVMVQAVNETDQSITRVATTAQQQHQVAHRMIQATRILKIA